ncbi:hypothetical protein GGI04_000631, partial [Coemansia thaxteri]
MGAKNSKEAPVYVYAQDVPISITTQLEDRLIREATSAKDTSGTRNRHSTNMNADSATAAGSTGSTSSLADKVDELVARELARILEKQQLEELKSKERQASTSDLLREIRDLTEQIDSNPA